MSEVTMVTYPAPVPPDEVRLAALLFLVPGLLIAGFGGVLMTVSVAGLYAGSVIALVGLVLLGCIPVGVRGMRKERLSVEVAAEGLRFPVREARLVLRWAEFRAVVLVEKPDRVEVYLAPVDEQRFASRFSRRGREGFVLSTLFEPAEAHRFAAAVEAVRPGLVRWPSLEVRRGGFGLERAAAKVVRWGSAKRVPTEAGASVKVRASKASGERQVAVGATVVLLVAVLVARVWLPVTVPGLIAVALCAAALVWTRHRGTRGVFTVDGDRLMWTPRYDNGAEVRRAEIAAVTAEVGGVVRVFRRDGGDFVLAKGVSMPAARAVAALVGAPPTPITRGAT
ncbi:hypothetical protein VSH64_36705 [Amycolatopsis rhabdoformis]|uniref:PH domain-containing protein n=1 Tax=Amycolatopsis rhabdoformis TaxID=1448059 RepID=A0ABZ1I4E0_9PSEU|nr:hypothetical protein [Amycolatopsis rhabdoformis]WSE28339.1 hypothetical protein VSH64_36705 [Amycolatopsis rhabdoformis]